MPPQIYATHRIDIWPRSVIFTFNFRMLKYPSEQVHNYADK